MDYLNRSPRIVLSGLTMAAVLFGASCAPSEQGGTESAGQSNIALLTSGPVSDAGWNAGAFQGLLLISDSMGAKVSHQQTRTSAEYDEAFISYADAGYDLIFGHGFEYQDAATRAGEAYPEVTFVVSAGSTPSANVVPLVFQLEEATYLAGMAAGSVTQSGIVGMVGGVEIPSAKGTFLAFEAGVQAVNPDATVLETFTGSWEDVASAKEAAVAHLRRGADVLIHNLDAAGFGVFQAVREAQTPDRAIWAMGMNSNQNDVAPEIILGSAVIDIPATFLDVAKDWDSGTLEGPLFTGLGGGTVDFVPNPELPLLSADVLNEIQEARLGIMDGTLEIPRIRFVEDGSDPSK
ncbi:MAG: BMP family protein [Longimicrobiales bacterium]